jgi:hypothetical protein
MQLLEEWKINNDIKLNKKKSGILIIRAVKRTPERLINQFKGYPVVESYKYIGIEIDNDIKLRAEQKAIQVKEKKMTQLSWLMWVKKLPFRLLFEAWQQLIISRFQYAKNLAANYSKKIYE